MESYSLADFQVYLINTTILAVTIFFFEVQAMRFSGRVFPEYMSTHRGKFIMYALFSVLCAFLLITHTRWIAYTIMYISLLGVYLILWHARLRMALFLSNAYILNMMAVHSIVRLFFALFFGPDNSGLPPFIDANTLECVITVLLLIAGLQVAIKKAPFEQIASIEKHRFLCYSMISATGVSSVFVLLTTLSEQAVRIGVLPEITALLMFQLILVGDWALLFYNIRILRLLPFQNEHDQIEELKNALMGDERLPRIEFDLDKNRIRVEAGKVVFPELMTLFSYSSGVEYCVTGFVHEGDRAEVRAFMNPANLNSAYSAGQKHLTLDFRVARKDNATVWYRMNIAMYRDPLNFNHCGFLYFTQINEQMEERLRLETLAHTDDLTGLLNKSALIDIVDMRICGGGIVFVADIDNFKFVNDTFGHLTGDKLLKETAERIKNVFRKNDYVARFGGDEFVAFIPGVFSLHTAQEKAQGICHQCRAIALAEFLPTDYHISTSVGAAIVAAGDHGGFDAAFARADKALYQSKSEGKNRYTIAVD